MKISYLYRRALKYLVKFNVPLVRYALGFYNRVFPNEQLYYFGIRDISEISEPIKHYSSKCNTLNYGETTIDNKILEYKVVLPDLMIRRVRDCNIIINCNAVFKDSYCYIQKWETDTKPVHIQYLPDVSISQNTRYTLCTLAESHESIDKGIFLGGSWPLNWFHWSIEILPKLFALLKLE